MSWANGRCGRLQVLHRASLAPLRVQGGEGVRGRSPRRAHEPLDTRLLHDLDAADFDVPHARAGPLQQAVWIVELRAKGEPEVDVPSTLWRDVDDAVAGCGARPVVQCTVIHALPRVWHRATQQRAHVVHKCLRVRRAARHNVLWCLAHPSSCPRTETAQGRHPVAPVQHASLLLTIARRRHAAQPRAVRTEARVDKRPVAVTDGREQEYPVAPCTAARASAAGRGR
jgi:hypothetical protein